MANYNQSVLTTAGLALANRAAKGLAKFKITRVTSTADVVGDSDISELTKLPNEVQVGSITGQQPLVDGDGTVTGTKVLFTNHNLQTSYKINAVGLYATEDGKSEILYSVITAIEPEFMPDYGDQVLMEFGMTIYVVVGQVDNMSIVVNPGSMATVAYVDKAIADHQVVFPETLTYSDRDEMIAGKWQFKKGIVNAAGDEYVSKKDAQDYTDGKLAPLATSASVTAGDKSTLASAKDYTDTMGKTKISLTDQLGGRNYVLDAPQTYTTTATNVRGEAIHDWKLASTFQNIKKGMKMHVSYDITVKNADSGVSWVGYSGGVPWVAFISSVSFKEGTTHVSQSFTQPADGHASGDYIHMTIDNSKATYTVSNMMLEVGEVEHDCVPAPEDKVDVADVSNWQKQKITADNGTQAISVNSGEDLYAKIVAAGNGTRSIYVNGQAKNNPMTNGESVRGLVTADNNGMVWQAQLTSWSGTPISIAYHDSTATVTFPVNGGIRLGNGTDLNSVLTTGIYLLANATNLNNLPSGVSGSQWKTLVVTKLAAGNGNQILMDTNSTHTWIRGWNTNGGIVFTPWEQVAMVGSTVKDNSNGSVTVNGKTYVPANETYTVNKNDSGNVIGTVKMPDGNLQSAIGDRFYPIKWFNSYNEAMTYSKAHPYVDCRW